MKKFVSVATYDKDDNPIFEGACLQVDGFERFEIHHHYNLGRHVVVGLHNGEGLHHVNFRELDDNGDCEILVFIGDTEEDCASFLKNEIGITSAHIGEVGK